MSGEPMRVVNRDPNRLDIEFESKAHIFDRQGSAVFVRHEGERVRIGYVMLSLDVGSDDVFRIQTISVEATHRERGYGTRIMKEVIGMARTAGVRALVGDMVPTGGREPERIAALERFYVHLGFIIGWNGEPKSIRLDLIRRRSRKVSSATTRAGSTQPGSSRRPAPPRVRRRSPRSP